MGSAKEKKNKNGKAKNKAREPLSSKAGGLAWSNLVYATILAAALVGVALWALYSK